MVWTCRALPPGVMGTPGGAAATDRAGHEVTLSASKMQTILDAAYMAEGNGLVEFESELIDKVNEVQAHLDRYLVLPHELDG